MEMKRTVAAGCVVALLLQSVLQPGPAFAQFRAIAAPATVRTLSISVGAQFPAGLTQASFAGSPPGLDPTIPGSGTGTRSLASLLPVRADPGGAAAGTSFARDPGATARPAVPSAPAGVVRTAHPETFPGRGVVAQTAPRVSDREGLESAASAFGREAHGEASLGAEGGRAATDAGVSAGGTFFDGAKRADVVDPVVSAASVQELPARRAAETRLLPAAARESGRNASGLVPAVSEDSRARLSRGFRPRGEYHQPRSVRVKEVVYEAAAWTLLPASLMAPFIGLGLVGGGVLLGVSSVAALVAMLLCALDTGTEDAEGTFERLDARTERRIRRVLRVLVRRLDLPLESVPRRIVLHPGGPRQASANGIALNRNAVIRIGEAYGRLPIRMVAAVLAHELGHLVHHDGVRLLNYIRDGSIPAIATMLFSLASIEVLVGAALGSFDVVSVPLVISAPALFVAGRAFAFASLRQMETRADDFSAWLTDPLWLSEFLYESFRDAFDGFAAHPSSMERIERLLDSTYPSAENR